MSNKKLGWSKSIHTALDLLMTTMLMVGNFVIFFILIILYAAWFSDSWRFAFILIVSFMTTILMVIQWYETQKRIIKQ